MKLDVFVKDQAVATLDCPDGYKHVLSYYPDARPEQFVSLLMPVRTESWSYPELHPFFRMNLPEGFLLSLLQETAGALIGASPLALLSVVGRNSIGRVKVAAAGADPSMQPVAFEVASILRGDNSEASFVELVRRFATSGVSGVVPKFLSPAALGIRQSGILTTQRYIIKGTTARLPGLALNEHFCMKVAKRANIPVANTTVSDDGQALVVDRFDYSGDGSRLGMEDLCSLLLLRPEQKYESTWERVLNRIKALTSSVQIAAIKSRLADLILLSYALRNADCHTKNVALLYASRNDIELAPVYDMLSTTVYDDFAKNPPALSLGGRNTWYPGRALEIFLEDLCDLSSGTIKERAAIICEAMVDVSTEVVEATKTYPVFKQVGPRMLHVWNDGMNSLRLKKIWSLPTLDARIDAAGFKDMVPARALAKTKIGRSSLSPMK